MTLKRRKSRRLRKLKYRAWKALTQLIDFKRGIVLV